MSERPLDTHDISRLHIGHLSCAPPNDAVYQYDVTGCAVRIGNTERAPQEIPALRRPHHDELAWRDLARYIRHMDDHALDYWRDCLISQHLAIL